MKESKHEFATCGHCGSIMIVKQRDKDETPFLLCSKCGRTASLLCPNCGEVLKHGINFDKRPELYCPNCKELKLELTETFYSDKEY